MKHACFKTAPIMAAQLTLTLALSAAPALADNNHTPHRVAAPEAHAPIMVMGDHMHKKGEYMVSLRQTNMSMQGNIRGTSDIADSAVLQIANQHSSPTHLRVVPQKMDMKMTMLGAMYAPSDKVTLLAMAMQMDNTMTLTTYNMAGNAALDDFTSQSSGTGDTILGALFRGGDSQNGAWHYGLSLSIPTASITATGKVLTPMNMRPVKRLPYPMQLGSGSYDAKPSLTYNGDLGGWRIGGQAKATIRLNDNDEDYRLGDKLALSGWAMKRMRNWLSASLRLGFSHQGKIDGQDANITLPVQTAQTNFSGGTFADMAVGFNLIGQSGVLRNHRLAIEWVTPLHQDAHGVQMKRDDTLTIGWQKAF